MKLTLVVSRRCAGNRLGSTVSTTAAASRTSNNGTAAGRERLKTIVAAQHSYAGVSGVVEPVDLSVLLDDALKINSTMFERHRVQVEREYAELPALLLDRIDNV